MMANVPARGAQLMRGLVLLARKCAAPPGRAPL
jgi:hypothetical protein